MRCEALLRKRGIHKPKSRIRLVICSGALWHRNPAAPSSTAATALRSASVDSSPPCNCLLIALQCSSTRGQRTTVATAERQQIRLASTIAADFRLRASLLLRSGDRHWSTAFPICNRMAVQAAVLKRDVTSGSPQSSPEAGDHLWLPKNIGVRNSPGRALRRQFRRNFATENANLPDAI